MTRLELAPGALADLDRFIDFQAEHDPDGAPERIADLLAAIDILRHSPLIGRRKKDGQRELVTGQAVHGYVARYRHVEAIDTVVVLAIRGQREAGYADDR